MRTSGKKTFRGTLLVLLGAVVVVVVGMANPALAQTTTAGMAINVFAEPQDFVVELDRPGRCGSKYFHILRSSVNFKEMVAVALTAFATSKPLTFFVVSCSGDRNIISHGYVSK